jgi:hypothetical protein
MLGGDLENVWGPSPIFEVASEHGSPVTTTIIGLIILTQAKLVLWSSYDA